MSAGFAERYRRAVDTRGRLCAGIDPHPTLMEAWGLPVSVDGLRRFAATCTEALGPVAAVIKPQVAFFESFGSAGIAVLEDTIAGCREAGALVIADAKRGDIGSTMAAYARAWLDDTSPLCSDAVTASPYLGFGSLQPALDAAGDTGRAVFVLARTSNPEGAQVQTAIAGGGGSVAQTMVNAAAARNADGQASVGVVVGATRDHDLDLAALNGPILAPGLGAQGAQPAGLAVVFGGADPGWVLPASSRGVLSAGPDPAALRAACEQVIAEVESVLRP